MRNALHAAALASLFAFGLVTANDALAQNPSPTAVTPPAPPPSVVKKPFQCTAPLSNYNRKRDAGEVAACLNAHAYAYAGVFHTFRALGVNPGKAVTFYVTVSPRGSVQRFTAGSQGPANPDMIEVIGAVIQKVNLGTCDPCQSETIPFPLVFSR